MNVVLYRAEADALPGINLPTRAQLQSFVESREVQQVLGALAPQIAATFAPLAQPAFARAPAEAPGGFPMIVPNTAVMPRPLPSDPPTPEQTQTVQEGAIQDGPNVPQDIMVRQVIAYRKGNEYLCTGFLSLHHLTLDL